MAAIVAEVAAVERFAPAGARGRRGAEAEDDCRRSVVPPPPPPPPRTRRSSSSPRRSRASASRRPPTRPRRPSSAPRTAARLRDEKRGFIKLGEGDFQLPGTDLLEYIPPANQDTDKQPLYDMAERLEQAMSNYGVRGKVKEIHMGPVVTMYEFAPAPGTRTGKIANLEKDLAMALEAQAVRIVAPIPGKAVGRRRGAEQDARDGLPEGDPRRTSASRRATSKLQVALGKDIKGAPVSVDLSKMPHLLVAGTTGSGKSVAVNGMITSLLYNASPEEVRFIMVDPKMLELSIYEGIPHLLLPVVTDPKKANLALRWAVDEMERRYELLAKTGVRDIASYNAKHRRRRRQEGRPRRRPRPRASEKKIRVVIAGPDGTEQEVDLDADAEITLADARGRLGGIVGYEAPSDEDLSDAAAAVQAAQEKAAAEEKPTQAALHRHRHRRVRRPDDGRAEGRRDLAWRGIAQKARAAGMHLILATQRPSVDVITGLIKANFPSRIALQVASKIDSRTILDQHGRRDAARQRRHAVLRPRHRSCAASTAPSCRTTRSTAWSTSSSSRPSRSTTWTSSSRARRTSEEGGAPADDFHDELYDQAVAIVCETRQASVSFIQRRLQIGYNRAARMVEQMERDGIVGPTNGAKPREVLAPARRIPGRRPAHDLRALRRAEPQAAQRATTCERSASLLRLPWPECARRVSRWLRRRAAGAGRRRGWTSRRWSPRCRSATTAAADFRARFTQTLTSAAMGRKTNSAGEVMFKKPGRMRWDYEKPDKSSYVTDGGVLWLYEPDDKQAFKQELKTSQLPAALAFLTGKGKLATEFDITLRRQDRRTAAAGDYVLSLSPKTPQAQVKTILFVVDPRTFDVRESVITDAQGNVNDLVFADIRVNTRVPDAAVQVHAPAGTRVIDTGEARQVAGGARRRPPRFARASSVEASTVSVPPAPPAGVVGRREDERRLRVFSLGLSTSG